MREVIARASAGDADASLALDVYVHRVRAGVGQMAGALERIDALVFTGGVGQHSEIVRRRVAAGLLGGLVTLVVEAREDLSLARGVRAALSSPG
jgi:acetate kinase